MPSGSSPPPQSTYADEDVLDRIYDVALNPDRFEELVDVWQARYNPTGQAPDALFLGRHAERADTVLERLGDPVDALTATLDRFDQVAVFAVGVDLRVVQANAVAERQFGLVGDDGIDGLPFHANDLDTIRKQVRSLCVETSDEPRLCRARDVEQDRLVIVQLRPLQTERYGRLVLVATSVLAWPKGIKLALQSAFGLTAAEVDVVQQLTMTASLQEVADLRRRSIATVRTQLKTILHKTETKSQVELIRLVLSMAALSLCSGSTTDAAKPGYQAITLPDGRRMQYREFGAASGVPVVFWPSDYGFMHWPRQAEHEATQMGLRVIVPVRGGYGASDALPRCQDVTLAVARDVAQLLDTLGVRRCVHLALGIDFVLALRFAQQFSRRTSGIVACSGVLPIHGDAQLARMDKWHRFILATAHFSPRLLPFFVKAGFRMARRQGKEAFVRAVFGGSPADMETFADPEVRHAILKGTELTLSKEHSAHEMFARLTAYQMTESWGAWLGDVQGTTPVSFLCGLQDTQVPRQTLEDYQAAYPWIDFQLFPDAGRLVFFRHWHAALATVKSFEK